METKIHIDGAGNPHPPGGYGPWSHQRLARAAEYLLRRGFPWLRFPHPLESAFRATYEANTLKRTQLALGLGVFLYALFGLADYLLIPAAVAKLWFIRFGLVMPVLLFVLGASFFPRMRRHLQPLLWLVCFAAGTGIIAMSAFDPFGARHYYAGVMLVIMFTFSFIGLRFWYSVWWAAAVMVIYQFTAIFFIQPQPSIFFFTNLCFISAMILGGISNYLLELYVRRDFLRSLLSGAEKRHLQLTSDRLRLLSVLDELTGIANRRSFEEVLQREFKRAIRSDSPLTLMLLDIDHFKPYNDTFGHRAGDECLRQVAACLASFTRRPGDLAARYGGEEFALIFPETGPESAMGLAETIRAAVENLAVAHSHSDAQVITVSIGVATGWPQDEEQKEAFIEVADQALYRAKNLGRNRVVARESLGGVKDLHPQRIPA